MTTVSRIVSLLPSATEMLCGLGLGDRIVGISHECDYPASVIDRPQVTRSLVDSRLSSAEIDRQVNTLLASGAPLYEVDGQLLARLAPELIVTQAQCDVCAVRYEDVVTAVQSHASLSAANVLALNPTSIDDMLRDIRRIGEAAGVGMGMGCSAQQYIERLQRRAETVQFTTSTLAPIDRPRIALIEWIEPLMLAGNWMPQMVDWAGGRCDLTTPGQPSRVVAWSDIVAFDPEVIVVAACGFDLDRTVHESRALVRLPDWPTLSAVKHHRVYAVDGNAYFNRAGPRLIESLEILAHLFHPHQFVLPSDARATQNCLVKL